VSITVSNTALPGSAAFTLISPAATASGAWAGATLIGTWPGGASPVQPLSVPAVPVAVSVPPISPLAITPGNTATYDLVFRMVSLTANVAGSNTVGITVNGQYFDNVYPIAGFMPNLLFTVDAADAQVVNNHIVENEMFLNKNTFYPPAQVLIVSFTVKQSGNATVKIYNVAGELVKTLFNGLVAAGSAKQAVLYSGTMDPNLRWDGTANDGHPVSSGTYMVFLDAPGYHVIKKVNLLR